jgi:GAF domain-containing protein
VLSAPLVAEGRLLGAVKVYAEDGEALTEADEHVLRLFGAQAGLFVANLEVFRRSGALTPRLRRQLEERDVVNQAVGVLMAREGVTGASAFRRLASLAERDATTVHEVATRLVAGAAQPRPGGGR